MAKGKEKKTQVQSLESTLWEAACKLIGMVAKQFNVNERQIENDNHDK